MTNSDTTRGHLAGALADSMLEQIPHPYAEVLKKGLVAALTRGVHEDFDVEAGNRYLADECDNLAATPGAPSILATIAATLSGRAPEGLEAYASSVAERRANAA